MMQLLYSLLCAYLRALMQSNLALKVLYCLLKQIHFNCRGLTLPLCMLPSLILLRENLKLLYQFLYLHL